MRFYLILPGLAAVLVGLGLAFPQIANIRDSGGLGAVESWALLFGVAISTTGIFGLAVGTRRLLVRRR